MRMASKAVISLAFLLLLAFISRTRAGWTKDGGYEGAYPGGCTRRVGECPPYEFCVYDEEECPDGPNNRCRCMYGCVMDSHYLRYQQWRRLPKRGICMCEDPTKNKTKCVDHLDEF